MGLNEDVLARAARVKLLLMDVDGVMTDGTYWQVPDGQGGLAEIKAFDSQDGIALQWLRRFGIQAGVISGRVSVATAERAKSAGFAYVYQGHTEKIPILEEILEQSGFGRADRLRGRRLHGRGRDAPRRLRGRRGERQARGEAAAPTGPPTSPGGHGALRDVVELMLKAQGRWDEILSHYELAGP